jgi:hypothetical protein
VTEVRARDGMVVPVASLVVAQVVHVVVPVGGEESASGSPLGLLGGAVLLALSVAALLGLVQRRPYARPLGARVGLVVALGFVAYHAVPWSTVLTNPYLGRSVGAPAWIGVGLAVAAGSWAAIRGRDALPWARTRPA